MSMRDKIAKALPAFQDGYLLAEDVADTILAELRDSIPDLVWVDYLNEYKCETRFFYGRIYRNNIGGWTLDDGESYSSHDTIEAAKDVANAHHKAQLVQAMGWTV